MKLASDGARCHYSLEYGKPSLFFTHLRGAHTCVSRFSPNSLGRHGGLTERGIRGAGNKLNSARRGAEALRRLQQRDRGTDGLMSAFSARLNTVCVNAVRVPMRIWVA